jgi:DNA polymerase/3'-5' exonuclease PolX
MVKTKRPTSAVLKLAELIQDQLRASCEEIAIAGSIRRQRAEVGDIEIVARPRYRPALFGDGQDFDQLHERVSELVALGSLTWRDLKTGLATRPPATAEKAARRFYPLIATKTGVPLDLFVVRPPASWGVIFAIRTGDADFSRALVTRATKLGLQVDAGTLWALPHLAPRERFDVPTERAFFEALRASWVPPEDRNAATGRALVGGL